jgi:hypothetical protein
MNLNYNKLHFECGWHEDSILKSKNCGCFHCVEIYPSTDIVEWMDESETCPRGKGKTAVCPRCGIDSVLPDFTVPGLDIAMLKLMHSEYFE